MRATLHATAGVLVAALLTSACGRGPAPACDDPATMERLLAHTFTAMLEMGMPEGRAAPELDWGDRTIVSGADTAHFSLQGDSLYVSEGRNATRHLVAVGLSSRVLYEDAEAGAWECEAAVDARQGIAIPVRYTSTRNAAGEHVVRGSLKGGTGEVVF